MRVRLQEWLSYSISASDESAKTPLAQNVSADADADFVNREYMAQKKGVAICSHLGVSYDPSVSFYFAHPNNYCYRASPAEAVRMFCQDSYCLSANFTNCPVYKTDWSGPLPFDIRAGSLGTRRGSGYYTWLALGAVILLLMLSFGTIVIFLKDRPTIPDYQSVAQATSPIYESLMVTGTSIPAPALLIVPTSTPTFPPTQTRVVVSANTPTAIPTQTRAVISISTPTTGPTQALVVIATSTPTTIPTQTPIICAPPEDWVAYTVQPGDSLQLFRQIYGIRKSRILVANCNEGLEEVIPGQIFFLPYLPSTPISVVEPPVVPPNQLPRYTPQPEPPSYRP